MPDANNQPGQFARYPSLVGRSVLVTGGASGIGASLVANFARQGSRVAFFDIDDENATRLVESITGDGLISPTYIHGDLTDLAALKIAVEQVVAAHGDCRCTGEQRRQRSAPCDGGGHARLLGPLHGGQSTATFFHSAGSLTFNARCWPRGDYQYELDCLDDSLNRPSGLHCR